MSETRAAEFGELNVSGVWGASSFTVDEAGMLTADEICLHGEATRADSRVRLDGAWIRRLLMGGALRPGTRVTVRSYDDAVLALYVVRLYDAGRDAYEAEWPD